MNRQVEILAPAGSYDSFIAAIAAGADAVYIGGTRFGARAYADNLDEEMMLQAIDYAHLHGRKVYLTVNTLLKEHELKDELYSYLLPYYRRGLDAVIVQDIGVLCYIREQFPDLPIHASTQMTITNALGAKMLERLGVERVVTSRELQLEEIKEIIDYARENNIIVEGIYTHLYYASNNEIVHKQMQIVSEVMEYIDYKSIPMIHIMNSEGLLTYNKFEYTNGIRVGDLLYGLTYDKNYKSVFLPLFSW